MATDILGTLSNFTANDIRFSDACDLTAKFAVLVTNHAAPVLNKVQNPNTFPYAELIAVLRAVHPIPFANTSRGAIVDWADTANITSIAVRALNSTRWKTYDDWGDCTIAYCRDLTWEGNADIAGIGVFVSYIFEVVLATIFLAALSFPYISRRKTYGQPVASTLSRNTWVALHTSLGTFWDTTFIFSFSVGIAGIVSSQVHLSWYDRNSLAPSLALSGSVLFATWPLYIPNCRHTTPRWIGLFVILAMLGFLCTAQINDEKFGDMSAFDLYCMNLYDPSDFVPEVAAILKDVTVFGFLGPAAALVIIYFLRRGVIYQFGEKAWPILLLTKLEAKGMGPWVLAWCILPTVLMYAGLVYFALMRYLMFEAAGDSLRENRWGFGQVLALATWVPAVVDFLVIWRGHLKALKYRLPVGVEVRIEEKMKESESEGEEEELDEEGGGGIIHGGAPGVGWGGCR